MVYRRNNQIALVDLIQFSAELNQTEKDDFKESVKDLTTETPRSQLAITKFKFYSNKVGIEFAKGLKDLVVGVATEVVKKAILEP